MSPSKLEHCVAEDNIKRVSQQFSRSLLIKTRMSPCWRTEKPTWMIIIKISGSHDVVMLVIPLRNICFICFLFEVEKKDMPIA
jgi:hypothetical protein